VRIFLTGATGFIGAHVLHELLARGHDVACLKRPATDGWRIAQELNDSRTVIIPGDMNNIEAFSKELADFRPEAVIHLAWQGVDGSARNTPEQMFNIVQTLALFRLAADLGVRSFIGLGSQAEYGPCAAIITETQPARPQTLYGVAKLSACHTLAALCAAAGMRFAWLRLFSAYGPKDGPSWLIPHIALSLLAGKKPALSGCEQVWDYIHSADAAAAIAVVTENENTAGIFNLGAGQAVPLRTIAEKIRDTIDPSLPLGFGEIPYAAGQTMHLEADIGKITAQTGWRPRIALDEGIRQTAHWYRDNATRFQPAAAKSSG